MGFNSPSATPMITMKFDKTRLDRLFKDAPKKLLVAAGTEIRTAARIFAAVAAKNTLPYGAYEAGGGILDSGENEEDGISETDPRRPSIGWWQFYSWRSFAGHSHQSANWQE
jgi:hypothetical protein